MTAQPLPVPVGSGESKSGGRVPVRNPFSIAVGWSVALVAAGLMLWLSGEVWIAVQHVATRVGAVAAAGLHLAASNQLASVLLVLVVLIVIGAATSVGDNRRAAERPFFDVR